MTTSTTMREVIAAMNTPVPVTVTPGQTTGPVMVELQPGTPSLVCGGGAGGRGGTGGAAGSGAAGAPGTAGMGGSVVAGTGGGGVAGTGTAGATGGSGGASGRGGNGNTICAIPCSSSAYCDNGTCRTRITEFDVPTNSRASVASRRARTETCWFVEGSARKIRSNHSHRDRDGIRCSIGGRSGSQSRSRRGPTATCGSRSRRRYRSHHADRRHHGISDTDGCQPLSPSPRRADGNLWLPSSSESQDRQRHPDRHRHRGRRRRLSRANSPRLRGGPDGNVWFVESGVTSAQLVPNHAFVRHPRVPAVPTPNSNPRGLTAGRMATSWYTAVGKVGRMTVEGTVGAEFSTPSSDPRAT